MKTFTDLQQYIGTLGYRMVIASEAETRRAELVNGNFIERKPEGGGVSVALEPVACASNAVYIARAKSKEEMTGADRGGKFLIETPEGNYTLKRLFFNPEEVADYYEGYSNQTLWPLSHVTFEKPLFDNKWFEGYKHVDQTFAKAIRDEVKGKTFIWLNDYQLAMVPSYLGKPKDTVVGMFWHIPWPTWEIFRILPQKREILASLLSCDFLAFHRGYHMRNFVRTVEREFETRIDQETSRIYFNKHYTTVSYLPMGIDTDVLKRLLTREDKSGDLHAIVWDTLGTEEDTKKGVLDDYFEKYKVIFGLDRLDYTKGIDKRLLAIDRFFEKNRHYIGKVVYLGVMAPSRETIPAYKQIRKNVKELALEINKKYEKNGWKPIHLIHQRFPREEIVNFYSKTDVCLVTPLDDGMNLVSKEFIISSSLAENPGMLVLSQFAGSAIDLTEAVIINPYDIEEVADGIKTALEMDKKEKIRRVQTMAEVLEERNVYEWAEEFIHRAIQANRSVPK